MDGKHMKLDGNAETSLISSATGGLFILIGLVLLYTQHDNLDYAVIAIGVLFLLFGIREIRKST